jgi:Domain of unknown function (DUF1842)
MAQEFPNHDPESAYRVVLEVSNNNLGASQLQLDLVVLATNGDVHGAAKITNGSIHDAKPILVQVSGAVHHTGLGQDQLLVHLTGEYAVSVQPPAIGTYLAHFSASLAVDRSWNGKGSFTYDRHHIGHCTVKKTH